MRQTQKFCYIELGSRFMFDQRRLRRCGMRRRRDEILSLDYRLRVIFESFDIRHPLKAPRGLKLGQH